MRTARRMGWQARTVTVLPEIKAALWGVAMGSLALPILGFTWGGWVTPAQAEVLASERAEAAVVQALVPLCVERFQRAPDLAENQRRLARADAWRRNGLVEKGGWATLPGSGSPGRVTAVAEGCAALLLPPT